MQVATYCCPTCGSDVQIVRNGFDDFFCSECHVYFYVHQLGLVLPMTQKNSDMILAPGTFMKIVNS